MLDIAAMLSAFLLLSAVLLSAQTPERPLSQRDQWQRPDEILKKLNLRAGAQVADIGAGSGYFTEQLAHIVGVDGRVLAVEVNAAVVEHLRQKFKDSPQVAIVHGGHDNPKLPDNRLEAVLIVDAYHEFRQPTAMLEKIRSVLKPGARLVLADFTNSRFHDQPRDQQVKQHVLDPLIIVDELKAAGFDVHEVLDPFIARNPNVKSMRIAWNDMCLIVASRPAD